MVGSQKIIDRHDLRNYLLVILFATMGVLGYIIITGFIFESAMSALTLTIAYPIIATLTSVFFSTILFVRAKQYNVRGMRYMLIFGFSLFMFNLLQVFRWDVAHGDTPFKRPLGNEILNLADIFITIAIFSLYLHFESIENDRFHPIYGSLVALTIFPLMAINFVVILTQNEDLNLIIEYFLLPFSVAVIFIIIYGIRIILRIYLFTEQDVIKKGTMAMMISIIYMGIAFTTQTLTSDIINFGLFEAEIHQLWLFALATSMLSYAYIVNPYFLYSFPFNISEIIIYDHDGIPLWDYKFSETHDHKPLPIKSSALSAIGGLLKEVSGFSGSMTNIQFTDGSMLITVTARYTLCLITEKNSRLISWAFKGFSREMKPLIEKYMQKTLRYDFSEEDENEAKGLITKFFPFVTVV